MSIQCFSFQCAVNPQYYLTGRLHLFGLRRAEVPALSLILATQPFDLARSLSKNAYHVPVQTKITDRVMQDQ